MKYTAEEALTEILRRSERLVRRRNRWTDRLLAGSASALLAVLVLVISLIPGGSGAPHTAAVYGSFLLSAEAGGYVLASVIAFVLGIVFTLLCTRRKTPRKPAGTEKEAVHDESENTNHE